MTFPPSVGEGGARAKRSASEGGTSFYPPSASHALQARHLPPQGGKEKRANGNDAPLHRSGMGFQPARPRLSGDRGDRSGRVEAQRLSQPDRGHFLGADARRLFVAGN